MARLINNKTQKEYHVSEEEAQQILSNEQLRGVYSRIPSAPVPEEVKKMREQKAQVRSSTANLSSPTTSDSGTSSSEKELSVNQNK